MPLHAQLNYFNSDFVSFIEEAAKVAPLETGLVEEGKHIPEVRTSEIRMFENMSITNELLYLVNKVNTTEYSYDIFPWAELQYTEYRGSDSGHYDWHVDQVLHPVSTNPRKFSVTVQLSDPDEYEGGDFKFSNTELPEDIKQKGTALVFPSYELHCVTPVTKGIRKSLVAWFRGPAWR